MPDGPEMSTSAPLAVSLDRDGALLRLRLARPKANLIDAAMIAALHGALRDARGRSSLRGVLLEATRRGEGQTDVHALLTMIDRARFRRIVRPGDKLELAAETILAREEGGQIKGKATVDGELVASAELGFAFARVTNPVVLARRREVLNIWLTGSAEEP